VQARARAATVIAGEYAEGAHGLQRLPNPDARLHRLVFGPNAVRMPNHDDRPTGHRAGEADDSRCTRTDGLALSSGQIGAPVARPKSAQRCLGGANDYERLHRRAVVTNAIVRRRRGQFRA
jgi:hypothetical protein